MNIDQLHNKVTEAKEKIHSYIDEFFTNETSEKVKFINILSNMEVLPYNQFIGDIFIKQKEAYNAALIKDGKKAKPPFQLRVSMFDMEHRGQSCDLAILLEMVRDDIGYTLEKEGAEDVTDEMIYSYEYPIFEENNYKITYKEIVDTFYNWVKENKKIGFHFDW